MITFAVLKEFAAKALQKPEHMLDAFLELHIEQGPQLEAAGKDIGVVTAVAAPSMIRVEFDGAGGHGGGMPMRARYVCLGVILADWLARSRFRVSRAVAQSSCSMLKRGSIAC